MRIQILFYLLLFDFTSLFNYLFIRLLQLISSSILIAFARNNVSFYTFKTVASEFNFSAARLVRNSEYTFFEAKFDPRVQWSWRIKGDQE